MKTVVSILEIYNNLEYSMKICTLLYTPNMVLSSPMAPVRLIQWKGYFGSKYLKMIGYFWATVDFQNRNDDLHIEWDEFPYYLKTQNGWG